MAGLFHEQGALRGQELAEFIRDYQKNGRHNWDTRVVHIQADKSIKVQRLLEETSKSLGRLTDRLALTIIELSKGKRLEQHSGDCTIYAALHNGTPESGVCTCGYGLQVMRETGSYKELYSKELKDRLMEVQ